jgi:hypothetical protein
MLLVEVSFVVSPGADAVVFASGGHSMAVGKAALIAVLFVGTIMLVVA